MSSRSIRAQKYVKNKIGGMSNYQAAIRAGYSPATAKNARKNVENHGITDTLHKALETEGITNEVLAKGIMEGLSAMKVIQTSKGLIKYPDHRTRLRYIQLAVMLASSPLADRQNLTMQVVSYDDERLKVGLPIPIMGGLSVYGESETSAS